LGQPTLVNRQRVTDAYAFIVPSIRQHREAGSTLQQIADSLIVQGHVTTRQQPFTPTMVHRLLARAAS
jgi:hypothetical protein